MLLDKMEGGKCIPWPKFHDNSGCPSVVSWASVFPVSSEGPSHSDTSYDTQRDVDDLLLPGSPRVPIQSPLAEDLATVYASIQSDQNHKIDSQINQMSGFKYLVFFSIILTLHVINCTKRT
jgi:hypothetical protein